MIKIILALLAGFQYDSMIIHKWLTFYWTALYSNRTSVIIFSSELDEKATQRDEIRRRWSNWTKNW